MGADGQLTKLFTAQDSSGESIPHQNSSGGTTFGFFYDDLATGDEAALSGKVYDLRIWPNKTLTQEEVEEAVTPPGPPTGVTATAGDASATVNWTASEGATSYEVTSDPGGAKCTATAPATSCVVRELANGTAYKFTVVAIRDGGSSAPTEPSGAVTPVAAAASTTTSVTSPPAAPVEQGTTTTTSGGAGSTDDGGGTTTTTLLAGTNNPAEPAGTPSQHQIDNARLARRQVQPCQRTEPHGGDRNVDEQQRRQQPALRMDRRVPH